MSIVAIDVNRVIIDDKLKVIDVKMKVLVMGLVLRMFRGTWKG